MRFSIIVPIYKVENYLTECIESVLSQDYLDYELVLVDDGSPDTCPRICDEYAAKDHRIRVIHKENGGLSDARNAGIQSANGEYIVLLDGDDCLYENMLARVSGCIEKYASPEMIIGNVYYWYGDNERLIVDNKKYIDFQETRSISEINEMYAADLAILPWAAYQSVWKKKFLIENHLVYTDKLIGAEDVDFYLRAIKCVPTYRLTDIPFVRYRTNREGSIINTPNLGSVYGRLDIFSQAYENASDFGNASLMRMYFANWYTNIVILVNLIKKKEDRDFCYTFIKEHKEIIKHTSKTAKYIVARVLWGIFGIEQGSKMLLAIKNTFKI